MILSNRLNKMKQQMNRSCHVVRAVLMAFCLTAGSATSAMGQASVVTAGQQEYVRAELEKRGLQETEVRARLVREGIFIDAIPLNELPEYRGRIVAILDQMEREMKMVADSVARMSQTSTTLATAPITTVAEEVSEAVQRVVQAAADSTTIYGHSIFTSQSLDALRTTDGAQIPETYVLGPGDLVRISIFGASQADLSLEISSDGSVQPAGVPKIFLQGLTLAQSRALLRSRLASFYTFTADQFVVTVQTPRTVAVNIFGETLLNGTFTISALNSAFNAVSAAGGPTAIGSVRRIERIRGTTRRRLDVYEFLRDPQRALDFDLQANDIIFVPSAQTIVRVSGAVRRPMRYELVEGEGLREVVTLAGGILPTAYAELVQVQRIEGDSVVLREWRLADILTGEVSVALTDGDIVRVRSIGRDLEAFVDVTGAVVYDGQYDLASSPTLADVLRKAQLTPSARTDQVFLERLGADGVTTLIAVAWDDSVRAGRAVPLRPRDRVLVYGQPRYVDVGTLRILGAVRVPVERAMGYADDITVASALDFAGGLRVSAADIAYVKRRDPAAPEFVRYIPINVRRDTAFVLRAGDDLTVYDQRLYTDLGGLSIGGAVRDPQRFDYDPALTITDLIRMAGGTTSSAALDRVEVIRLLYSGPQVGSTFETVALTIDSAYRVVGGAGRFQLQPFDQIIVRQLPLFDASRTVQLDGAVQYPGVYPLAEQVVYLTDVLKRAGGLSALANREHAILTRAAGGRGPVGVDLKGALRHPRNPRFDPILLQGDVVNLLERENTVSIRLAATRVGELVRLGVTEDAAAGPNDVIRHNFQGERSAKWYVQTYAGGFASKADKWSVTVTDASGQVRGTTRTLLFFRSYPKVKAGSTIALQLVPEPLPSERDPVDWEVVLSRTLQAVTSVLSIVLLASRL